MKYSREKIKRQYDADAGLKYIFFWGHRPSNDGSIQKSCLSQWWEADFQVNEEIYKTAEHWMMAEKARLFKNEDIRQAILNTSHPNQVKKFGRQVKGFKPEVWDAQKYEIVVQGNLHKFSQNQDLKYFLLNTGHRVLVEASPVDPVWGIGLAQNDSESNNPYLWKGENLLGFALMEVRDALRQ